MKFRYSVLLGLTLSGATAITAVAQTPTPSQKDVAWQQVVNDYQALGAGADNLPSNQHDRASLRQKFHPTGMASMFREAQCLYQREKRNEPYHALNNRGNRDGSGRAQRC